MEEDAAGGFWASYENGFTRWLERLQGNAPEAADAAATTAEAAEGAGFLSTIGSGILWFLSNLIEAAYNIIFAIFHPVSGLTG